MHSINFTCTCGRRLTAIILPPATPHDLAQIEFHAAVEPFEKITECPNCQKDLTAVAAEDFLESVGNWS
jgi:hypothetical protein